MTPFHLQLIARTVYWQNVAAKQSAIARLRYATGSERASESQVLAERCYARARALAAVVRGDFGTFCEGQPLPPRKAPAQLPLPGDYHTPDPENTHGACDGFGGRDF